MIQLYTTARYMHKAVEFTHFPLSYSYWVMEHVQADSTRQFMTFAWHALEDQFSAHIQHTNISVRPKRVRGSGLVRTPSVNYQHATCKYRTLDSNSKPFMAVSKLPNEGQIAILSICHLCKLGDRHDPKFDDWDWERSLDEWMYNYRYPKKYTSFLEKSISERVYKIS